MSVAIVLPARLASTRLPNKLLLSKTGRTLLEHTLERARAAQAAWPQLFTTVLVACDDKELAAAARRARVEAVLTDPALPSGTDRIAAAAQGLSEDVIVNLQGDEPEVEIDYLKAVAEVLTGGPLGTLDTRMGLAPPQPETAGMATLAVPILDEARFREPSVVKVVVRRDGHALYFSRAPIPFARDAGKVEDGMHVIDPRTKKPARIWGFHHLGLYAYRREFLLEFPALAPTIHERTEKLEQLRALDHGRAIAVRFVPKHVPGIDTPEQYDAFVERYQARGGGQDQSADLADVQGDWLDRGATFYGH